MCFWCRPPHPAAETSWKIWKQLWTEASSWRRARFSARPACCPFCHTRPRPSEGVRITTSVCLGAQAWPPSLCVQGVKAATEGKVYGVHRVDLHTCKNTHVPGRMLSSHTPASRQVRMSVRRRGVLTLAPEHCQGTTGFGRAGLSLPLLYFIFLILIFKILNI